MSAHDPDTPARLSAVQPFPLSDKATVTKILHFLLRHEVWVPEKALLLRVTVNKNVSTQVASGRAPRRYTYSICYQACLFIPR